MHDVSKRGGSSGHGLRQLGKAVSGYLEERSVHGRRSGMSSRNNSIGKGLNGLGGDSSDDDHQDGVKAGQKMNQRWRNSLDEGSGSMGRRVNALKPAQ